MEKEKVLLNSFNNKMYHHQQMKLKPKPNQWKSDPESILFTLSSSIQFRLKFLVHYISFICFIAIHFIISLNGNVFAQQIPSQSSSSFSILRIPDQQAFIGKLFFYQIDIPANVKNFTLIQAGYRESFDDDSFSSSSSSNSKLPKWLYFDSENGLLFGAPNEKRIYFIQVEAIENNRKYEDIFVIETIDPPSYLLNQQQSQSLFSNSINIPLLEKCRIEFKKNFKNIKQIYETIVMQLYRSYFKQQEQQQQLINSDQTTFKQWLNQFNVQIISNDDPHPPPSDMIMIDGGTTIKQWQYHLSYEVQECREIESSSSSSSSSSSKLQLDDNSQLLLKQLDSLKIDSELIKITHNRINHNNYLQQQQQPHQLNIDDDPMQYNHLDPSKSLMSSSESSDYHHNKHHNHHKHGHHGHHRRRNAFVDDENIYETPALNKELWSSAITATTSTIDYSMMNHLDHLDALSRTAIPSMLSPTFTLDSGSVTDVDHPNNLQPTPTLSQASGVMTSSGDFTAKTGHILHRIPSYPQLYGTPVLMPEMSTISKSINLIDNNLDQKLLFTPVFTTTTSATPSISSQSLPQSSLLLSPSSSSSIYSSSIQISRPIDPIAQPSLTVDNFDLKPNQIDSFTNVTTTTTTTTTTEHSSSTTTMLNHRPFVKNRISKLSITAGKFWQFSIPEDTFYDAEDGNTRQLRIGFFMDSEILPADYWIQFDNENQYLYALPTEEDIGRHRFNLNAVDFQGGEATETIEIYVRQSRQSLSFTHKFILANITWDNDRYPERIQAVSSILQRMAIQVFEEMPFGGLNEAAQRQAILKHINVLNIYQNPDSLKWSIIWTNDSLRRHPCPVNEINLLFSRLYDITYPENEFGFMAPSTELRSALSPDFTIERVKRLFIGRSACGSHATNIDNLSSRHKDKIVFSNRLNRIGPYRLGSAFKFQIPKDTVYSMARQVDTRQLALSLAPLEPEIDLPSFIYFDTHEQTIYGLPFKQEHIRTYELKLIAEDTIHGGSDSDLFALDIEPDQILREDYLFEIKMSFLYRNIELASRSQQHLTPKDFYQVAHSISTKLMGNSNLEAFRMLDIGRYRFNKISMPLSHYDDFGSNTLTTNNNDNDDSKSKSKRHSPHYYHDHHHHQHHNHHLMRQTRSINNPQQQQQQNDYFYEFVWTNRTLVTSIQHSKNILDDGLTLETNICPEKIIKRDIYQKLFPQSAQEFLQQLNLEKNLTNVQDIRDVYNQLFDPLEANLEFMSVEWQPKSVCSNTPGLNEKVLGAVPIRDPNDLDMDYEEEEITPTASATETEDPSINIPVEDIPDVDEYPSMMYFGDRLLAMLIPPVAILIALLFAVTIGCCFHRANQRRKAVGTAAPYHDESPTLYRQRIPIQLEFERGGTRGSGIGMGGHPSEQESMLDTKFGRHPVQIMPPKLRGPSSNLPAAAAVGSQQHGLNPHGRHANLPYQMLPQQ